MTTFEEGALVFAKMKGFPFWPAKVINTQTAPAKYCVSFFGSRETAFVKASDIVDYLENRHIYERKNPKREEFRLAVEEIRKEAGLPPIDETEVKQEVNAEVEVKQEPAYGNGAFSETVPTAMDASQPSSSSYGRVRKPSYRVSDKDFIQLGGRNRNNSNSFNMDSFGFESRQRTDSNASLFGFRKRNGPSFSFDNLNESDFNPNNFLQGDLGNVFDFDSDGINGINHTRRRRRTTSRLLDEIIGGTRERNFSNSSDMFRNDTNLLDLFESAGNILDPAMFYNAIDLLPSEESDRPQTPENIAHMPGSNYCQKCCSKLKLFEDQWKCTNAACVENDVKLDDFDNFEAYFDVPTNNNAAGSNFFGHKPTKQKKKKKSIAGDLPDDGDSPPGGTRAPGRPRSYKVEKTPPVQNGVRLCIFCNGHVRPQMCGGNKHRWRCVDKRCRKWYGWVRSNEEIPKDLGKKGRWKDLVLKVQGHTDDGKLVPMMPGPEEIEPVDSKLKKKKKRVANVPPPLSPISEEQVAFQATPLEMRAHWWRPERKRVEPSPEREFEPGIVDTAAVMRLAEQSNRAASITTKSMEHAGRTQIDTGTATGFIDLMFDQIFASIGPLMALATNLPHMQKFNSNEIRSDLFSTVENLPLLNP